MTWREFRPDLKGIATTPLDPAIPLDPAREFRPDLKGIATRKQGGWVIDEKL